MARFLQHMQYHVHVAVLEVLGSFLDPHAPRVLVTALHVHYTAQRFSPCTRSVQRSRVQQATPLITHPALIPSAAEEWKKPSLLMGREILRHMCVYFAHVGLQ